MRTINNFKWKKRDVDAKRVQELSDELKIDRITSTILVSRGIDTPYKGERFLNPSLKNITPPYEVKRLDRASLRIISAVKNNEKICIYGDYDADGITATAMMVDFLKRIGADVIPFIPDRIKDGYGLKAKAIHSIKQIGVKLIVTVDCGIGDCDAVREGRNIGIDFIITDHHNPAQSIPDAIVINPKLDDSGFSFKELSGVGIAFYLCMGIRRFMRENGYFRDTIEPNLFEYLDLVALGTVTDVVPLLFENRVFVKEGIKVIKKAKREGIKALLVSNSLIEKDIDSYHLGFILGPRINAPGRLANANMSLSLLLENETTVASSIARELNVKNAERQSIETSVLRDAISMIDKLPDDEPAIVLQSKNWHPGVIGIVASKLVDMYFKPVILFSEVNGVLRGSARSIKGINIVSIISGSSEYVQNYGGHELAAGVILKTDAFFDFKNSVFRQIDKNEEKKYFEKFYDDEVQGTELDSFMEKYALLEPFGYGNPEPVFLMKAVKVKGIQELGNRFFRIFIKTNDSRGFTGFATPSEDPPRSGEVIDIFFTPEINLFNGKRTIALSIKGFRRL